MDKTERFGDKMDAVKSRNIKRIGAILLAIKMTMADGTVIEGTVEELAKLQELTGISEESEEPAEKPSIKVGDYAKVIGETYCNVITEGAIVEVTQEADCDGDYRIELIDGSDYDFAKPEALEKIELSEADLVFIENGREPGEYKDGDIVEIIANTNYSANEVGDIGVVEYISAARTPLVNVRGRRQGRGTNHTAISDMKIIAFVESRVDIDA